ncbi:MAG TPA: cupin domain-containing protein [Geminicoccus sp.]|jgi:quercetin dioxygenase-like cupin family protein|uniref:cupin domain-containing protein n=1 Tax=Geminicoccus sp. TaxID=2024832 RepID=UPI002E320345|nr:cupin domain-containing protein [Geminicoccus sp.]HEX2526629.1 cupin domain-containing protein [Geminicoccus sp.]
MSILPSAAQEPGVTGSDDVQWFDGIPGERTAVRVRGTQVQGRFSVIESVAAPGCAAPLHTHVEEETFYIVAGHPTFRLGDQILETSPGDLVLIPAGTPHAWINRTTTPSRMIATFAPGGIEELFTRLNGLAPEGIAALAASYGTVVLGPPMSAGPDGTQRAWS